MKFEMKFIVNYTRSDLLFSLIWINRSLFDLTKIKYNIIDLECTSMYLIIIVYIMLRIKLKYCKFDLNLLYLNLIQTLKKYIISNI